jgi:hypothetical protein
MAIYRKENSDKIRKLKENWELNNPNKMKEIQKEWRLKNQERRREYDKKWRKEHKDKVKELAKKTRKKRTLLGKTAAAKAKYRAAKLHRTLPGTDLKVITEFYKNCPKGMVVDHIIPLQGIKISGLHKVENLQYLTPRDNSRKWNKY